MPTKICPVCKEEKDRESFKSSKQTKDGLSCYCIECNKRRQKEWYQKNKEKTKERVRVWKKNHPGYQKEYWSKNREKLNKRAAERRRKDPTRREKEISYYQKNRQHIRAYDWHYKREHRQRLSAYCRVYCAERKKRDPLFKLKANIRSLIRVSIERQGYFKTSKTQSLLCCSYEDLMVHLGPRPNGDIHIDHICPCAQAQNEEELLKLQHYSNLRWILGNENLEKSSIWSVEAEEMCRKLLGREWITALS